MHQLKVETRIKHKLMVCSIAKKALHLTIKGLYKQPKTIYLSFRVTCLCMTGVILIQLKIVVSVYQSKLSFLVKLIHITPTCINVVSLLRAQLGNVTLVLLTLTHCLEGHGQIYL